MLRNSDPASVCEFELACLQVYVRFKLMQSQWGIAGHGTKDKRDVLPGMRTEGVISQKVYTRAS